MSHDALAHGYVLTENGVEQLADLLAQGSAPVSTPGFTSHRPTSPDELDRRLRSLQQRLTRRD